MRKALFIFSFLLGTPLLPTASAENTRIGVSTALTGEGATFGHDVRDVLIFANEKVAQGRYQFDFQDDKCDPKTAADVARKFAHQDHYRAVTGFPCSGPTLAAAPIFEKAQIPMMVLLASSPQLRSAGKFIFRSAPGDDLSGAVLASWIEKQNISRLAVLSAESDYCQDLKNAFLNAYKKPTIQEDYLPSSTDFRATLLKLRQSGVDAIFLNPQFETTLLQMLRDLTLLKWKPKLFSAYYPSAQSVLEKAAHDLEGMEFVDLPNASDILNDEGKKFYAEYTSRFGPVRSYNAIFPAVFEGFRALHLALQSGEDPVRYLETHQFEGLFGPFRFDHDGEIQGFSFVMKRIENGKAVQINP